MFAFSHLGQVEQACPKAVVAGDLQKSNPLPGVQVQDDPDKDPPAPGPVEQASWFKWGAVALGVWSVGKVVGVW